MVLTETLICLLERTHLSDEKIIKTCVSKFLQQSNENVFLGNTSLIGGNEYLRLLFKDVL